MLEIEVLGNGEIRLTGQFNASQVDRVRQALKDVKASCALDLSGMSYISSAGLGLLLETQQRLSQDGHALHLSGLNPHVRLVFEIAGFDQIFDIT